MKLAIGFLSGAAALAVLASCVVIAPAAQAQQQVPPAPAEAPAPAAQDALFAKPDPANFTASTPTKETVDAFMNANWGFNQNLAWQVEAIFKTDFPGISKVIVAIADKSGKQPVQPLVFYTLPDGKHIMVGDIAAFGDHPFATFRDTLQQHAEGPYRGNAAKDLEIVEFADFQCPHCKAAQANMDQLAADFPKARIVFQHFPLAQHPQARPAAAYGVCVAKQGGSSAFFTFASSVFEGQDGLATPDGATLTLNAAVVKAGLDPAKIAACSTEAATQPAIDASIKLAKDVGVNETPTLFINGRAVLATVPYETLKQIVQFQLKLDGLQ